MTSVYETRQNSSVGHVRTFHSLRMHFCLYLLLFKGNFQKTPVNFPKMLIFKIL